MRLPKYRRHSLRDFAFIEYKGRRLRLPGRYNSQQSKAAYRAFLGEIIGRAECPPSPVAGGVIIAELVEQYLIHAATYYGANQEYGCAADAAGPLLALHAATLAEDFGPLALDAVRQAMVGGQCEGWSATKRRWSRKYINHQVRRIVRMFRWGASKQLVPAAVHVELATLEPLRRGKTAARESAKIRPVPDADVQEVITTMVPVNAAMLEIQWITGMRSDNLCSMRWQDIDTNRPVWLYVPERHKSLWRERGLFVPLGPRCQAILNQFRGMPPEQFLFSPRRRRGSPGRYTPNTYRKAVLYTIRRVNRQRAERGLPSMPDFHPHQLRHNAASRVRAQFGIEGSRVYLGHATAAVTEIYAERDASLAEQIAAKIG